MKIAPNRITSEHDAEPFLRHRPSPRPASDVGRVHPFAGPGGMDASAAVPAMPCSSSSTHVDRHHELERLDDRHPRAGDDPLALRRNDIQKYSQVT